jgi:D-alanyl-lipoteichoic acid acyltransferase DltB (MBOAT superfamily)
VTFTEPRFGALLAITLAAWIALRHRERARVALLLVASLVFYGDQRWHWLVLLIAYAAVDWVVARRIAERGAPRRWLLIGLGFNLGTLVALKLAPLIGGSTLTPPDAARVWGIPAGVSFYAFIGTAYLIDVFHRVERAETNPWRFGLFLSFFPHLVTGPILRAREFLPALQPGAVPQRCPAPLEAAVLLGRGYFKKAVLADRIGAAVDPFFAHVADPTTHGVWALPYLYLYALQIYFDFSGYTDIARGLALLFGFRWPENFHLPYLASSVREFWHRWHMTLSAFLRDYLYVPLGGNRGGELRTHVNLFLTFLIGGLWHGVSPAFLVWGALHALYLSLHRCWSRTRIGQRLAGSAGPVGRLWHATGIVLTFHCVCVAWTFFRLPTLAEAASCLTRCIRFDPQHLLAGGAADAALWALLAAYAAIFALARRTRGSLAQWSSGPPFARGLAWGCALGLFTLSLVLSPAGPPRPFIYFQF